MFTILHFGEKSVETLIEWTLQGLGAYFLYTKAKVKVVAWYQSLKAKV